MQTKQSSTGLVWFKNNLRVQDNLVLNSAINNNSQVLAVYVFELKNFELTEFGFKKTEKFRARFLIESIENLKQNLKTFNIELFVYVNNTESHLKTLIESFNVSSVYLQKEWTFEECIALEKVKKAVSKPVIFYELYDQFLYEPDGIDIAIKNIPEVFTNFRKKLEKYEAVMSSVENHASQTQKTIENPTKIPTLNERIQFLKSLNPVGLKKLYQYEIKKRGISNKGGAGLGLIIITRKSEGNIICETNAIDNNISELTLKIKVPIS